MSDKMHFIDKQDTLYTQQGTYVCLEKLKELLDADSVGITVQNIYRDSCDYVIQLNSCKRAINGTRIDSKKYDIYKED